MPFFLFYLYIVDRAASFEDSSFYTVSRRSGRFLSAAVVDGSCNSDNETALDEVGRQNEGKK